MTQDCCQSANILKILTFKIPTNYNGSPNFSEDPFIKSLVQYLRFGIYAFGITLFS